MRLSATLLILFALVPALAAARPASIEGKWRFNPKESELLPGEAAPAELIMAITKDDPAAFRWTVTVTMSDGASGAIGFDGAIDGKAYPVKGRDGSTSKFSWQPDGSLKRVDESAGGVVTETCAFSKDMRKMSCEAKQIDIKGRAATYTEVFDRL